MPHACFINLPPLQARLAAGRGASLRCRLRPGGLPPAQLPPGPAVPVRGKWLLLLLLLLLLLEQLWFASTKGYCLRAWRQELFLCEASAQSCVCMRFGTGAFGLLPPGPAVPQYAWYELPSPRLAILCLQNLRLYRELASVLMDAQDYDGLIAACQRFGDARTGALPADCRPCACWWISPGAAGQRGQWRVVACRATAASVSPAGGDAQLVCGSPCWAFFDSQ